MNDPIYRDVRGALAKAMEKAHASALDAMTRQRMEHLLACASCGVRNLAGLTRIELSPEGVATCRCGYVFLPHYLELGRGYGYKGRAR